MKYKILFIALYALMIQGCTLKKTETTAAQTQPKVYSKTFSITVENHTGHELYGCCFYYAKRDLEERWTWHKSKVTLLPSSQKTTLTIPVSVSSKEILNEIQGYLSVFTNKDEAEMSIVELLSDEKRIPLGRLSTLNKKNVKLVAEKYGFKGERLEYTITPQEKREEQKPFETFKLIVQNNIGKNVYLTGFLYELAYSHPQWDFEKLPVAFVPKGHNAIITIPLKQEEYNLENINGYLAIFDGNEKQKAEDCTYESLLPQNKVKLGVLTKINNQKLVLEPKVYGVLSGFDDNHPDIEFTLKPPRKLVNHTIYPHPPL
jgi:hypothetical protein